MLILILISVQCLVVFSSEKGSNGQNHALSDFHHSIKKDFSKVSYSPYWGNPP